MLKLPRHDPVASSDLMVALRECRRAFWGVGLFSSVFNLLMLTGPIYMLQIYDRVLASRSVPTLVALSLMLVTAYAFQGVLDAIRLRIVTRAAALFDSKVSSTVYRAVIAIAARNGKPETAHQPVRDLDQIRTFLTGTGPLAVLDAPWAPVFLTLCFLIHPWIGILSLIATITLFSLALATERASRKHTRALTEDAGTRLALAETDRRNNASIISMGMGDVLARRWVQVNERYIDTIGRSADTVNSYGSASKVLRLLFQSAILGLGAYLVIRNEVTAGAMIASSIMMGRALAPIEIAIANWRGFVAARDSFRRLTTTLMQLPQPRNETDLPPPSSSLSVENVMVAAPGANKPILANVNFRIGAGQILGIIGPNGSGKSSLARVIAGIWSPARGAVRIDGAALDQWKPEARGRHIGYLSQIVELFPGTIAENIARMSPSPDSEAVLCAANAAGAHDMILRLPGGYDTVIGDTGELSMGQRQRIALARALYGDPFLVLLDEPSTSLDGEGEMALQRTMKALKSRGAIVIVVVHRRSALNLCDYALVLVNGAQQTFGPRDEVLRQLASPRPTPAVGANLKVVGETPATDNR
jgi:ATP-binding cassette subfamily C protein